jgi:hypothetical protein
LPENAGQVWSWFDNFWQSYPFWRNFQFLLPNVCRDVF